MIIEKIDAKDKHLMSECLTMLTNKIDIGKQRAFDCLKMLLDQKLGKANDSCFGAFLASMQTKGATDDEIIGLMDCVMNYDRKEVSVARSFNQPLCGIVGSGKDQVKTFNISSLASIVAAACGVKVLKNGSRSEASVAGTTDVFENLGLKVEDVPKALLEDSLNNFGFAFCDAKQYFPKMGSVYMGKFYFVHPLSYILPVASGCKFDNLVFGLASDDTEKTAKLLLKMGYNNSLVVSGRDENGKIFDELSNIGETKISEIKNNQISTYFVNPQDFGLKTFKAEDISEGHSLEENTEIFLNVLKNKATSAQKEIVALNAGALIYISGLAESIKSGKDMALNAIENGVAYDLLQKIIILNGDYK